MAQQKKKRTGLKVFLFIVVAIVAFMATINIIPPKKNVENNPFIIKEGTRPMIAAHRGGADNNPENTLLAYREAVKLGVDVLESDLYLTKDGILVCNHDSYIDETCNVNGDITFDEVDQLCKDESKRHQIGNMTLEELRQYNFGYYFEEQGTKNRIYKDKTMEEVRELGLEIPTVDELFGEFYESNPDLMFIIEIKNSGEEGYEACRLLNEALNRYPGYRDRVVVGTFNDEIETELKTNEEYCDLLRGAPTGTAAKFIITQFLGVNLFDNSDFACLQIPMSYDIEVGDTEVELWLNKKTLIDRAHRRNIAVQYWTINDEAKMRELIELGCDCIMTDDPVLLKKVLDDMFGKE